jgi:hypothetical protein
MLPGGGWDMAQDSLLSKSDIIKLDFKTLADKKIRCDRRTLR